MFYFMFTSEEEVFKVYLEFIHTSVLPKRVTMNVGSDSKGYEQDYAQKRKRVHVLKFFDAKL